MTVINRHGGFGILPIMLAVAFFVPMAWTFGPKFIANPMDVTPNTQTKWFTFRSMEGPFRAEPGKECSAGELASKFSPGDTVAWISDLTVDAGVRVSTQAWMERVSDHTQYHSVTLQGPPGRRNGPITLCYQTPKDTTKGAYELHRLVHFYPEQGADFVKEWPVVPFEVN